MTLSKQECDYLLKVLDAALPELAKRMQDDSRIEPEYRLHSRLRILVYKEGIKK